MSNYKKKSVISVDAMIDLYLNYGIEEDTWNMLHKMACHDLISRDNWIKFFETCKDWTWSEDGNSIIEGSTGKILYYYDENGNIKKTA